MAASDGAVRLDAPLSALHGVPTDGIGDDGLGDGVFARAIGASDDVQAALGLARELGSTAPRPAAGSTRRLFELLATLGAADVTVARVIEPHLDALAILDECPEPVRLDRVGAGEDSTWGVFAAEGHGMRLAATPDGSDDDGWLLEGTKPWCSLAGVLSHALVTAFVPGGGGGERRLFAVALQQEGVVAHPEEWKARGFPRVPSGPTEFAGVRAVPVGGSGWYLRRAGFEWGGIGVSACWFGGAVGLARHVVAAAADRGDDLGALHAGRAAASVFTMSAVLAAAAEAIDGSGSATGEADADAPADAALLAQLTRTVVRRECEAVLLEAAHALGPAPLAHDEAFAARVADLELYLRQDHGARDEARAGRMLVTTTGARS